MERDKVSEIMTNMVVTASESHSIYDIACLMASKNIGSLLITDTGHIRGIITERDILSRLSEGSRLYGLPVTKLMTRKVLTIKPDTRIVEAADLMINHLFRRLPVVEHGILVGIVTATDLTFEMNSPNIHGKVKEYMSRETHTSPPSAYVTEAVKVMVENNIGATTVVDGKEVVGILSERDIMRNVVAKKAEPDKVLVSSVMSDTIKISPDTQVNYACHLMYYYGHRRFPVVDDRGKLIGMVTERDLLKAMRPNDSKA